MLSVNTARLQNFLVTPQRQPKPGKLEHVEKLPFKSVEASIVRVSARGRLLRTLHPLRARRPQGRTMSWGSAVWMKQSPSWVEFLMTRNDSTCSFDLLSTSDVEVHEAVVRYKDSLGEHVFAPGFKNSGGNINAVIVYKVCYTSAWWDGKEGWGGEWGGRLQEAPSLRPSSHAHTHTHIPPTFCVQPTRNVTKAVLDLVHTGSDDFLSAIVDNADLRARFLRRIAAEEAAKVEAAVKASTAAAVLAEADAEEARRNAEAVSRAEPTDPALSSGFDERLRRDSLRVVRLLRAKEWWGHDMREAQAQVALQEARAEFAMQEARRLGGRGSGGGAASGGAGAALCVSVFPPTSLTGGVGASAAEPSVHPGQLSVAALLESLPPGKVTMTVTFAAPLRPQSAVAGTEVVATGTDPGLAAASAQEAGEPPRGPHRMWSADHTPPPRRAQA